MTDRRTLFMKAVHKHAEGLPQRDAKARYAGPGVVGGLGSTNDTLDPILTNYVQIRPRDPAWSADGAAFIAFKAPGYVVDAIRYVDVSAYDRTWQDYTPQGLASVEEVCRHGDGTDHLIAFEGGTGSVNGSAAAWSLMGYVLKRTRANGKYDLHIVFRGSRSGNPVRAAAKAANGPFNGPEGNADWISDMGTKLVVDDYFGGEVSVGFAGALRRCAAALNAALWAMHSKYGAPESIQVAGHSLGAALASLFCGAVARGTWGEWLEKWLDSWPWKGIQGYFYALPPTGSEAYAAAFDGALGDRTTAPYVKGDPVVEISKSLPRLKAVALGLVGDVTGAYSAGKLQCLPRPQGADDGESPHEIYLVRAALVAGEKDPLKPLACAVAKATPMGVYATFGDMLEGKAVSFVKGDDAKIVTPENLGATLANSRFSEHFLAFLGMIRAVVENPKAYRGLHASEAYALAGERVGLALSLCQKLEGNDPEAIVDAVATQVATLCGFKGKKKLGLKGFELVKDGSIVAMEADDLLGLDFATRLGLGLVLRALHEKPKTTVADYAKQEELRLCLAAFLGDVADWQKKKKAEVTS